MSKRRWEDHSLSPTIIKSQFGTPGRDQIQGENIHITNTEPTQKRFPADGHSRSTSQPSTKQSCRADIFISHWSEEKTLALLLADWIACVFQKRFSVFVSSDAASIKMGDRWLDEVEKALHSARLALILVSKRSLERHWVNFEAGFAWSRGMPVVFLCHSGLDSVSLPQPYAARQSLDIQEPGFPEQFLKNLAKRLNVSRLPPLAFVEFEKQLANTLRLLHQPDKG